jgi:Protein of unknown function (DUF1385)
LRTDPFMTTMSAWTRPRSCECSPRPTRRRRWRGSVGWPARTASPSSRTVCGASASPRAGRSRCVRCRQLRRAWQSCVPARPCQARPRGRADVRPRCSGAAARTPALGSRHRCAGAASGRAGRSRSVALVLVTAAMIVWMFRGRTLRLHGAEHRAIAAAEARSLVATWHGKTRPSRFSPRCGTNFAALMVPVSVVLDRVWVLPTAALTPVVLTLLSLMVTMEIWFAAQRSARWAARVLLSGPGFCSSA